METLVHGTLDTTTQSLRHLPSPQTAHPASECPACHSGQMCWIANEKGEYNYLCEACGRCLSRLNRGTNRASHPSLR